MKEKIKVVIGFAILVLVVIASVMMNVPMAVSMGGM